jgi:hypothetical protein
LKTCQASSANKCHGQQKTHHHDLSGDGFQGIE